MIVADDVGVVAEVVEHLQVRRFAVAGVEAAGHLDRIAGPIERGRLAQQRPARAIEEAADHLVLLVIVRDVRIIAHIPTRPAPHSVYQRLVVRV